MHATSLSWSIRRGDQLSGGHRENPKWSDIEGSLEEVKTCGGVVTMDGKMPETGLSQSLQVRGEHGRFLVTYGKDDGDDYCVVNLDANGASSEQVEILGEYWDARAITTDFSVVVSIFREFYQVGWVQSRW